MWSDCSAVRESCVTSARATNSQSLITPLFCLLQQRFDLLKCKYQSLSWCVVRSDQMIFYGCKTRRHVLGILRGLTFQAWHIKQSLGSTEEYPTHNLTKEFWCLNLKKTADFSQPQDEGPVRLTLVLSNSFLCCFGMVKYVLLQFIDNRPILPHRIEDFGKMRDISQTSHFYVKMPAILSAQRIHLCFCC